MKKLVSIGLFVVMAMLMAGCGSSSDSEAGGGDDGSGSSDLVIYSAMGNEISDPILELFQEQHPEINVETIHAGAGELLARIKAETDNPAGDILWGGETTTYDLNEELFSSYESPNDKEMIVQDPEHKWHAFSNLPQAILVNTDELPDESTHPTSIEDLADPNAAWLEQGNFALSDPGTSGTGVSIIKGMASLYDWEFVGDALKNASIVDGSSAMFDGVKDGEFAVGFINEDLGSKWESAGLPVRMIYPEDGVTNQIDAAGIILDGPNEESAQTFIDFVTSEEVHMIVRDEILRRSAREDIDPPEGFKELDSTNLIENNQLTNEEIMEEFENLR